MKLPRKRKFFGKIENVKYLRIEKELKDKNNKIMIVTL